METFYLLDVEDIRCLVLCLLFWLRKVFGCSFVGRCGERKGYIWDITVFGNGMALGMGRS